MSMPEVLTKVYKSEIKSFNDSDLILTHFISTEQEDRSKDIVRTDGIRFDGMPVVLKQHGMDPMQGMEPIAKPLTLTVGTNDKGVKGMIATTQYYDGSRLTPPDNTGKRLYEKAKNGYMPYWSIGYRIEDGVPRQGGGVEIRKSIIYEYSQVAVPDNVGSEVIKSFEDGVIPVEKVSNEFFTFGMKTDMQIAPTLPVPVTVQTTFTKSISERIALDLPMRSLFIIWDGFIAELFNTTADKVTDVVLELGMLLEIYAKQVVEYLNPMDESEKSIMLKFLLTKKKDFDADRAPSKPVPVSEIVNTPEEKFLVFSPVSEKLVFKFDSKPTVVPKEPSIKVDPAELKKMLGDMVHAQFTDALNKLRGKLD